MSLTDDLLQALKLTLPDNNVNIVVVYPGSGGDSPSYVDLTISNGNFLNGLYDSYCIDVNQGINPGQTYQAQLYSSYNDPLPTGIIDKPENLDEVNWLINQKFLGQQAPDSLGAYTSGDMQVAIWTLLEDAIPSSALNTVGAYDLSRVSELVEAARQNGAGFVPGLSQDGTPQDIAIIVVPVDQTGSNIAQSTINILKTAALGDFVWEDLNANGVQDTNEAGVEGVTVTLTGGGKDGVIGTADDTTVTTTTDANGSYLFPLLLPGVEYKVTFSNLPTGFVFTQSNQGNDTTDSDADPLTGQAQIIELNPNEFNRTIDAGIYRTAGLGDFVFNDVNNNGIQDTGEVGVSGVVVELIKNGSVIATTTTNSSGGYQFSGLIPGDYQVKFTAPAGYVFSTANQGNSDAVDSDADPSTGVTQTVTLTSGEFNGTLDAGLVALASLGNFVFEDKNANGIQDSGETGIGNATVNLLDAAENFIATTTTNSSGLYSFTNLQPGDYKVQFVQPSGFNGISPKNIGSNDAIDSDGLISDIVNLSPGENDTTVDAGFYKTASLGDFVFNDANNNGIQDTGEVGVSGVVVELIKNGSVIATTTTNSSGGYQFSGLIPGDYQVKFTAPTGYIFSTANQGSNDELDSDANPSTGVTQTVTLTSGEFNGTLDAGLVALASLGNFVFEDKNANGIQDSGETGIGNATVNLLDAAENFIATTTTNSSGLYSFTNLQPGDYKVQFVQPNGFNGISPKNIGSNDAIDSDGLISDIVNLSPGENDTTVDAGFYKTASLGDFVFNDANNNGIQDTGEVGVAGVTVTLTGGGADGIINGVGDTTVTTTTNASGNYNFSGLTPGQQYQVGFSGLPAGFQFTQANVGANDAVDSDAIPSTGKTQIVTLVSGENNLTLDAGIYQNAGDLSITKTDGLTNVTPGQQITYTIVARNNGLITATNALVSDIIPSNLTNVTWTSVASGGATDNQASGTGNINDHVTLTGGSSITYTVTGTVVSNAASTGSSTRFDFDGSSPLDGTDGNTRTFTKDGITITARAFSRVDGTNGAWNAAYLGSYGGGLGVTDSSEGNGGNNTHVVDNVGGRDNYVLFQFSEAVVLDQAYLQYVINDSDISVWIGNFSSPLTTLSDSTLNSFGFREVNETTSSSDRWADVNAGKYVGNTIVIAALDTDTSPEDNFKIRHLDVLKAIPASLVNTATITAPTGFTDTNPSNNSATDTNTIVDPSGDLSITKTDGLTNVTPGQQITYTIVARNNGLITATNALVSDIIPSNLTNVTWTSVASGGATDNQVSGTGNINDHVTLTGGSSITYTVTGTVVSNAASTGSSTRFDFDGSSPLDGTDGNTRTFTKDGITITARAFSRVDGTNGAWNAAYLGSYGGGLGVTDSSEGNGGNNTHVVDNVGGRDNYVLFQFSEAVVLDQAYLQYVINDSDISVWIGNFSSPLTTLSDSTLNSFGFREVNETTSSSDRWADVNAGKYVGNTIVIAALDTDISPEDNFKIRHLDVLKAIPASLVNTATITAPTGFTDTNPSNNSATDTNTIVAAPGVRTPDFWADTEWQKFWDGDQGNEPKQKTLASDLLFAPYTNSAQPGKVLDPVTGQYSAGLLIGDFNRNGITDTGEDTLFYTLNQARQIVSSSAHPNTDKRYDLGRSLVASWLNYVAGNPIDTANATDKDARYYIKEGINWLQALTPDENGDKKGDGAIHQMTGSTVSSPGFNDTWWNSGISSASSLPNAYKSNTNVSYGLDAGTTINSNLEHYNNGLGLADHVFSGGNA
ncbi:SdrD B-like domain-containing protein [Nostoc parmelioides]|uniref:Carboxypeptidase regulatory-like domain-containing protein n=1 Tax=Nostoc parmelioides FACHB-3921 TaxID=2692909 RepID=A0ABR8B9E8_9NOSO|nr:SdrD B-like domain-containing protein [Nostoc parmelioides]MBD2250456.1 carboxypeptidase regulatory-like domain-containing protein [Nostoc parmelioides FACHB-3921]